MRYPGKVRKSLSRKKIYFAACFAVCVTRNFWDDDIGIYRLEIALYVVLHGNMQKFKKLARGVTGNR